MDLKHLTTFMTLLLISFFGLVAKSIALPLADSETFISTPRLIDSIFHYGNIENNQFDKMADIRQKRDNDFIKNGNLAPEKPTDRRIEDSNDSYNSYGENQNMEAKKLFVPNFFG